MFYIAIRRHGKVSLQKITIAKTEVAKMLHATKKRYLMLTNMLRDLNLLQKLLVFGIQHKQKGIVINEARAVLLFFLQKTLISKIYEMWQFIKKDGILGNKSELPEQVRIELEKAEKFFEDTKIDNLFGFIRNKFGFHYDTYAEIEPMIDKAMEEVQDIEMWLSDTDSGNDIFNSSNAIMIQVVYNKMRDNGFGDDSEVLAVKLVELTLDASNLLRGFCVQYLTGVILRNVDYQQSNKVEIDAPLLSEVTLPLIVKGKR